LTIEVKPGGLLGLNGTIAQSEGREEYPPIEANTLSVGGRVWKLIIAPQETRPTAQGGPSPQSILAHHIAFWLPA